MFSIVSSIFVGQQIRSFIQMLVVDNPGVSVCSLALTEKNVMFLVYGVHTG